MRAACLAILVASFSVAARADQEGRGGSWTAVETVDAARRSGVEAGRAALAVDPVKPGRVYIGNSGVVQIDTLREPEDD